MSKFHILKGQRVIATADTLAEAEKYAKANGARVLQVAARANPAHRLEHYYFQIRYNDGSVSNHESGFGSENDLVEWSKAIDGWRGAKPVSVTYGGARGPKKTVDFSARQNPSAREEYHDPAFWAGEWIGEIVSKIREKASDVYYDEDAESLEYDGRACSLGHDRKGTILVTKISIDADDNMTEKSLKFGPSKSVADGKKIVDKAVAAILRRDNPSAATHAEIAKTDIRESRDRTGKAKAQTDTTSRREAAHTAIASALLAIREAKHSGNLELLKEALAAEDEAFEALIGPQVRKNGDGNHPAEAWAKTERKPAIDFGEMGNDRQALAKWLSEHPGKTAAFRSAGTVYHACNHGGQVFTVPATRRNGPSLRPDPKIYAEYQNLSVAVVASQEDRRKRLHGDWHAMSAEGPTKAEKELARFAEKIGATEWDRVTQQALRDYK